MKKIYVIGMDDQPIEKITEILEIGSDIEIVRVKSREDIPLQDRFKPESSMEFLKIHPYIDPKLPTFFKDKKRKGHERPYKYHK